MGGEGRGGARGLFLEERKRGEERKGEFLKIQT